MTPERWQKIKELLYQAQQLAPEERNAFLEQSCTSDRGLRHEVETLLASSDARSSFLENSPVQLMLAPGTKLGDYEIQKLLGSGGMGEVYRARDLRLRRDVAIKVLPSFLSSDKERLRRFEQEAQAAAALNHPNILAVFQMGTYEGAPYLVSELLEGETLRSQVQRGPLAARKATDYGVQIANGLAAAHEKGIVHRDLKPENLFVTREGRIKILDFGLAKLKQPEPKHDLSAPTVGATITQPGTVMGTAGYMSPEQVRGQEVDHRTDIFAFGAILYELLTGKRAFQKTTSAETMSAILNEEPQPVSHIVANIPPALQRTVHRCLEKSAEQRFQSASDLAFALEALSDSAASSTALRLEPAVRKGWRAGVLIAMLLLVIAAVIWWRLPASVPLAQGVRQISDDAEPKLSPAGSSGGNNLVTDGLRLYFAEGTANSARVVQIAVTGGQTSLVPMRLRGPTSIYDIAPDLSALLVNLNFSPDSRIQPLPSGEPRTLSLGTDGARFLPDGHIVFADANSLFLCNGDGSDRRKLVAAPGEVVGPAISPDGKRIRFTLVDDRLLLSIWEVHIDGTGLHEISLPEVPTTIGKWANVWTRDGKYFLFQAEHEGRWDMWALPESNGLLSRAAPPVQLTNGPLSYESAVGSRDGKQIFAVGSKKRGELIRFDAKSQQFVPYLDGISAVETRVSPDGKWILYVSYPGRTLWRSRSDGSERVQLTFSPMIVLLPVISPDSTRIAFNGLTDSGLGLYLMNIEGGTPEKVAEGHGPAWSPDGKSLAYAVIAPGTHYWSEGHWLDIQILDLRTKHTSLIPGQRNRWQPWWPQPNKLVTSNVDGDDPLAVFDFATQKWSRLGQEFEVDGWVSSSDGKYLYLLTAGDESKIRRVRASDLQIEKVADIKGVRMVSDDTLAQASSGQFFGLAPDGSLTFTRDLGSDEIYAFDVKWP